MMSVPYRYTKEYLHPVVRDGEIVREPFYQYVLYLSSDADRSACKRIFARYVKDHEIAQAAVGRGHIYSYPMREFVAATVEMFKDDIYIWCKATPIIRPWQK
jgi:aminoglycoside 3-N-acetyltransferase